MVEIACTHRQQEREIPLASLFGQLNKKNRKEDRSDGGSNFVYLFISRVGLLLIIR